MGLSILKTLRRSVVNPHKQLRVSHTCLTSELLLHEELLASHRASLPPNTDQLDGFHRVVPNFSFSFYTILGFSLL